MRKNIYKLMAGLAIILTAGYIANSSKVESPLSGVTLDNVEAIASGEAMKPCYGYGSTYCPYNGIWVDRIG